MPPFDFSVLPQRTAELAAYTNALSRERTLQQRQDEAYNALRDVYGPTAGDPATASALQQIEIDRAAEQRTAQQFPGQQTIQQQTIDANQAALDLGENEQYRQGLLEAATFMQGQIADGVPPEKAFDMIAGQLNLPPEELARIRQLLIAAPNALPGIIQALGGGGEPGESFGQVVTGEQAAAFGLDPSRSWQMNTSTGQWEQAGSGTGFAQFGPVVTGQQAAEFGLDPEQSWQLNLQTRQWESAGGGGVSVDVKVGGGEPPGWLDTLWGGEIENFNETREAATSAVEGLDNTVRAFDLVNQGINAGTFANIDTGLATLGVSLGIVDANSPRGQQAARTQEFIANRGRAVGEIIRLFGAGTGLSDADREYARQIAGGEITMTEDAIRNILRMELIAQYNLAENYNERVEGLQEAAGDFPLPPNLGVQIPDYLQEQMPQIVADWDRERSRVLSQALGADEFERLEEGGGIPDAAGGAGGLQTITDQAAYDALPAGTRFLDANGQEWTKP